MKIFSKLLAIVLTLLPSLLHGQESNKGEMAGYLLVPNERVPESFNAGFSMYIAAWPLLKQYPGQRFQSGLPGTWMFAKPVDKPLEKGYSDIEGGLGWWRDTEYATETPKFIMGGVAPNFVEWANGPGAGKGRDWSKPNGKYAVAQLSPWILWPPDGLNLKQGTRGEWFGYGYLPLPLTRPKSQTNGKNVPTGDQCWTLFINTGNFKGPVTFFTPYFWSRNAAIDNRFAGHLLDSRPSDPNRALQMETQHIPSVEATDSKGVTYARITPTQFPSDSKGDSALVHRITSYDKTALWDSVQAWFDGGPAASGSINSGGAVLHEFTGRGSATWKIYPDGTKKEDKVSVAWASFATPFAPDRHTFGYKWNTQWVKRDAATANDIIVLPEYYRLTKDEEKKPRWMPVPASEVPTETGLANVRFDRERSRSPKTYETPSEADSCWKVPGPKAGPFQATLGDGSIVTYFWYRFADQPALLNADMTDSEREDIQKRVELLHRHWTKDRNYLASPASGQLANLDPALIVNPPAGMEIGYVPIVTRQEPNRAVAKKKPLRVFIFAGQSNMVGTHSRVAHIQRFPPFADLYKPQKDVLFSYKLGREQMATSDGWIDLQPTGDFFGPELSFGRQVSQSIEAPVAIIKCASGGTTLGEDWNPDTPGGFKLYPLALEHVRSSLAELDRMNVDYQLEGFMWHQGENDMFNKEFKPNYGQNLKNFIASWRRDLNAPNLRFYIGELCTKTIWGMDNRDNMHAIRSAQKSVTGSDPLAHYVPTSHDAVEIGGDAGLHYHYGTLGQLQHGVNYAHAYLHTIGKVTTAERPLKQWPYAQGSPVKLFVLAGHRNMEGERAFRQELKALDEHASLANDNPQIAFKYNLGGGFKISNDWEPLGPAGPYETFGPELSFARTLQSKVTGNIAIAKFTHSGSQMNDWTPDGTKAKDLNLYGNFIAFIRDAIRDLESKGHRVELAGVFYHIGENDMAYQPYRKDAPKWLSSTIVQCRHDLSLPALRWHVSQQSPPDQKGLKSIDITANLAAIAAADPAVFHITAFDLPPQEENLVLNSAGIVKLGILLAQSYIDH